MQKAHKLMFSKLQPVSRNLKSILFESQGSFLSKNGEFLHRHLCVENEVIHQMTAL